MKIKVEFDRSWSFEEIKNYLNDPHNDRYHEMDEDSLIELVVCSYIYLMQNSITPYEMMADAEKDIAEGIEEYFYSELCENYMISYNDEIMETIATK